MPAEIDGYLITWVTWSCYRLDQGLGFSSSTTIGRVIQYGPSGAAAQRQYRPGSTDPKFCPARHLKRERVTQSLAATKKSTNPAH
jgi:hypothetical protein